MDTKHFIFSELVDPAGSDSVEYSGKNKKKNWELVEIVTNQKICAGDCCISWLVYQHKGWQAVVVQNITVAIMKRDTGVLFQVMRYMLGRYPEGILCCFMRSSKYPKRGPKIYTRAQIMRIVGG